MSLRATLHYRYFQSVYSRGEAAQSALESLVVKSILLRNFLCRYVIQIKFL
ncbi:hypothetical protein Riv7116_1628 [Rivularia sp. PCC 7116]|nr:hypothetical protein Riv7116_1628 [Rivularia sp. PCC 7116]